VARALRRADLIVERHSVALDAPPEVAIAAAREVTPREAPLARFLFKLRGLGATGDVPIVEQLGAAGFVQESGTASEIVLVAVGRPWRFRGGYAEGSFVRMTLRIAADGSELTTETRVEPSDEAARRRFLRYWRLIKPFSGLVRRSWLRAAARRASALSATEDPE
jgi:hypothetical protein